MLKYNNNNNNNDKVSCRNKGNDSTPLGAWTVIDELAEHPLLSDTNILYEPCPHVELIAATTLDPTFWEN